MILNVVYYPDTFDVKTGLAVAGYRTYVDVLDENGKFTTSVSSFDGERTWLGANKYYDNLEDALDSME